MSLTDVGIWIAVGFVSGSVPWALVLTSILSGKDAREVGDGNPGATNAWIMAGWRVGMASMVFDVGKSAIPVWLALESLEYSNRLVEHFARRGAIQEQLTVAIHNAMDTIISDNNGVAVMIDATHNCVQCRGVKHGGASMKTSKLTGAFKDDAATRNEYYEFVKGY